MKCQVPSSHLNQCCHLGVPSSIKDRVFQLPGGWSLHCYCMVMNGIVWFPSALEVNKSQQKNDGLLEEELDQPCQVVNICHTFQLLQIVLFHINPKQIFALSSQFKIYPLLCMTYFNA